MGHDAFISYSSQDKPTADAACAGILTPRERRVMTISITLTPDQQRKLEELARQRGKDPSAYVHEVVAAYLKVAGQKGDQTFEQILAPIWEGWRRSGMTEDEVDELFERELQEVRHQRRAEKGTP
jgi:predicted transcriptional regulator